MYRKSINPGEKFGQRIVIEETTEKRNGYVLYLIKCICGNISKHSGSYLRRYPDRLCNPCSQNKNKTRGEKHHFFKHGHINNRIKKDSLYTTWISMRDRCRNKNNKQYKDYGGRGIFICKEWEQFSNFKKDMGSKPLGHQLDRVDNEGPYCKENCRWASIKFNQNNKRNTTFFNIDGQKVARSFLEQSLGLSREQFRRRLEKFAISYLQSKDCSLDEMRKALFL